MKKNITTLDEILDKKYGEQGTKKREQWEQEFEAFQLGVLLEEARFEKLLEKEKKTESKKFSSPMSIAELNERIDKSGDNFKNKRYKTSSELIANYK